MCLILSLPSDIATSCHWSQGTQGSYNELCVLQTPGDMMTGTNCTGIMWVTPAARYRRHLGCLGYKRLCVREQKRAVQLWCGVRVKGLYIWTWFSLCNWWEAVRARDAGFIWLIQWVTRWSWEGTLLRLSMRSATLPAVRAPIPDHLLFLFTSSSLLIYPASVLVPLIIQNMFGSLRLRYL